MLKSSRSMIDAKVGAFAVTDHHVMDVERIKEMQSSCGRKRITIFPGIELRTELGGSSLVHMIGIFPECV
jgi:predicted metal-dependent phosphoesterase TrpH